MRKLPFILVLIFFVVLTATEVGDFLVRDEGVSYFKNDWRRLLYILAIGLMGGLFFGLFTLLSKKMQARIKFMVSGFTAFCCTCFTIFFLAEMVRLGVWASQNRNSAEIVSIFASAAVVNAVLWLECWMLRQKFLLVK